MSDMSQITDHTLPPAGRAGRAINDSMPAHVAGMMIRGLNEAGKVIKGSKVLIMGLAYKENVADIRESPARGIVEGLSEFGVDVYGSIFSQKIE